MRQILLLLLLLAGWGARAQTLLQQQSFETTEAVNYTASTVAAGSSNIYFYNATLPVPGFNTGAAQVSTVTNINGVVANSIGTHFWASENVRRDASGNVRGNPAANVTLNALNVAGKSNLSVTVALADAAGLPNNTIARWETDDYVRVQYNLDNNGWVTIGQFVGDDPGTGGTSGRLRQDANRDGISNVNLEPNSPVLNQALTDYSFAIPGTGSSLQVRVQIDQDGASEEFGFDNIRVYGASATSAAPVLASIEGQALAYSEGAGATAITGALTVTDPDSPTLSSAVVTISTNYQGTEDRLSFTGDGTTGNIVAGTFDTTLGRLSLTSAGSTATPAQWQNALRKVLYQNIDPNDASPLTRTVSFNVTDGANVGSNTVTRNITVATALDAAYVGLPYVEPFESEGEGTRYASNHFFTQNAAQFQRTNTNPIPGGTTFSNIVGSYYWVAVNTASPNINPTGTLNGTVTTKQINTAGYANLRFQIRVGASTSVANGNLSNWTTTDYFQLLYRTAGSSTWTAFGLFRGTGTSNSGGLLRQDSNPNGTGAPTGQQLTAALQNFDFPLPSALAGQTLEFQMLAVVQDGVNFLAFDQLQVTGTSATTVNSIVRANPNPTNATTVNYTVTFGNPVTGLTASNFTLTTSGLTGATIGTPTAGSGNTWTVPVSTGSGSGTLTLNLANDVGLSADITTTLPFAGETYTIDKTAPTVSSVTVPANGSYRAGQTLSFTVNFSEAVTVAGTPQLALTIGSTARQASYASGSGSTALVFSYIVQSGELDTDGITLGTLALNSGTLRDAAGNNATLTLSGVPSTAAVLVDAVAPTVVISSTAGASGSTTATSPFPFTVTFSESVTGFVAGDVTVSNGTISGFTGSGTTYTFTVTPTTAGTAATVNVLANVTVDQAGNGNTAAAAAYALTFQAPTIVVAPATLPNGTQAVAYSQTITASGGTAPYTFAVSSGALPSGLTLASNTGTLSGTPTASGSFTFTVSATDASTGSGPYSGTRSYTLIIAAPATTTVALTQVTPSPSATTTVTYRATFATGVTGLSTSNFSVANASTTVTGASVTSVVPLSTTAYNVVVNTGTGNGTLVLQLVSGAGVSPAVSNLPASGPSYTITKSFAAQPQLTIVGTGGAGSDVTAFVDVVQVLSSGAAFANGLQNSSFEIHNPLANGNFGYQPTGASWTFNAQAGIAESGSAFTPVVPIPNGIAVAFVQTVNGNNGQLQQNLAVPTGTSYQVSFQAAQRVCCTTLDQALNVFLNGVYLGTIRPVDGSGYSTFTSPTFAVTAPALAATVSTTSASPTGVAPIPFAVTFSQSVGTTFTAADVTVTGGTLTSGSFSGSGSGPYTFTVTPSASGTISVNLVAGVATDANNTGNSASSPVSVQYQLPATAAPVLTTPANGATTTGQPTYAGTAPAGSTVTLYLTPNGGAAQAIGTTTATGGSFSLTPATALASGTYSVYATAQSSGATGSTNSNMSTFTVDATAPTVVSSNRQNPVSTLTNATTLTYRLTFSEAVTGVSVGDFSLTSTGTAAGTVSAVAVVSTSVYDVTVTSASGDGTLRLDLNNTGTGIADLASNALAGGYTSGQAYTLDQTAPIATISTTAANPTSTSPIPFTVAFSEAVSGFTASGVTVTNGTITTAITNVGNAYSFSITPTGNGTVGVSVAANAAQDAAGNGNPAAGPVSITYTAPVTLTTWTGASSTDWFTAANWTAGVPTVNLDAVVPVVSANRYPLISAGTATVRNLTLDPGTSLSQGGGTLQLRGNLTNNGTFTATAGTVATTASTSQTLGGSSPLAFQGLNIGAGGATLATSTSFQRALTLTGNLITNGQSLTLLSRVINSGGTNVAQDGLVVNNGGVVVGTVTVQRAIDPSLNPGLGYRHYSSPVSNSTVADLTTSGFTPVVNPAFNTDAMPYTVTPYPTVFGYDNSRLALVNTLIDFDKGFFSPTALSDALVVGQGYTVNIGASEVIDFQGTLTNGTLTLPFTSTRASYPDGGWQLLGNPYPAPLDYSRVAVSDRVGLDAAIYIYSSTSQYGGQYRSYVNGIGSPVLPIGQGFFARVAAGQSTASLTFRNTQRLTLPFGTTLQRTTADPRPLVQLTLQGSTSALLDEAYVYFENGAGSGFEPEFDAEKLANPTGLNLSTSLANGQQLSIDGQPELGTSQRVVPLAVGVPAAGVYTFTASQLLNLSAVPVYLRDRQLGTLTDLRQQPTYSFTVSNAAALNTTRFELVFSPQQVLATVPVALAQQVGIYPNPAKTQVAIELPLSLNRQPVTATLLDALGRIVRTQVLPAGGAAHTLPLADLATGVYSLRLTTEMGTVVKKLVIE